MATFSQPELTWLITLCRARSHNLLKMIRDNELEDETEILEATRNAIFLDELALKLAKERDGPSSSLLRGCPKTTIL